MIEQLKRTEYPRPSLVRDEWLTLNGTWNFRFDDNKEGLDNKWYIDESQFTKKINVPFAYQSKLSGINDPTFHDYIWYQKKFIIPSGWNNKNIILHFGAVDYYAKVYLNGTFIGKHTGGHTAFSFDITKSLINGENNLVVYVEDSSEDEYIPRGKQFWEEESKGIWYTRTSGIWQSVWIEPISKEHIESVHLTPLFDKGGVEVEVNTSKVNTEKDLTLEVEISFKGKRVLCDTILVTESSFKRNYELLTKIFRTNAHDGGWCWSPESPNLFDITLKYKEQDNILDKVNSYFGMRKVHYENGMFFLNNKPYYQKLVLDQGYWPDGLLTAPDDEDFKRDIELAKEMGFNGCRKHQKVEDARFFYWADRLGFLVWGEAANAISYNKKVSERMTNEWYEIVNQYYNFPSIVTWVPLNESWGVPRIKYDKKEQNHSLGLYYTVKSLDLTRLVISNDGWELTKTDICGIHNYNQGNLDEEQRYLNYCHDLKTKDNILASMPAGKKIYADNFKHDINTPILLTEFGGIAYASEKQHGWGYSEVDSQDKFIESYKSVVNAVYNSEAIHGFCYTQLTDVEQEVNGLLTYNRKPKCDLKEVEKINNSNIKEKIIKN